MVKLPVPFSMVIIWVHTRIRGSLRIEQCFSINPVDPTLFRLVRALDNFVHHLVAFSNLGKFEAHDPAPAGPAETLYNQGGFQSFETEVRQHGQDGKTGSPGSSQTHTRVSS